jgi:hypothetical protein
MSSPAAAAGVSVGNVSKVKNLVSAAIPDVLEALRDGEVSIHRAASWMRSPERQFDELRLYRDRNGIRRVINSLQAKHHLPQSERGKGLDLARIARALIAMDPKGGCSVIVAEVRHPGQALLLSSGLLKALESQGDLPR